MYSLLLLVGDFSPSCCSSAVEVYFWNSVLTSKGEFQMILPWGLGFHS